MARILFTVALLVLVAFAVVWTRPPAPLTASTTMRLIEGWDLAGNCFVQPTLQCVTTNADGTRNTVTTRVTLLGSDVRIRDPWVLLVPQDTGTVELRPMGGRTIELPAGARTAWRRADGSWVHDSRALPDLDGLGERLREHPDARLFDELRVRAPEVVTLIARIRAEIGSDES